MEKIILPQIKEEIIDKFSSRFIIEPLYPGYGATVGNAIRRVLLSSIPGSAITSFKVEGMSHEFSAIPHVKEDMIEIMLNLKNLRIKSNSKDPVKIKISKNGPGEVTASDFSKNSNIEIIDPKDHIADLDNKAKFELEATVEFDRGFRSSDDMVHENKEIGELIVDASFSPVERVMMNVENTRVGRMTNYDKVILEIYMNGSMEAKDAIVDAANMLIEHFKEISFQTESLEQLTQSLVVEKEDDNADQEQSKSEKIIMGYNDPKMKIQDAGFSPRSTNALITAGIKTIAGLKRMSDLKLSEIKGLGQKGIQEIKEKLGLLYEKAE